MKIAIAHDYLIQMGGAERVVEVLHHLYPEAPIYTTVINKNRLLENLKDAEIHTTWLQKIPGVQKNFKSMLPLYPLAIRDFNFADFDIVLSSSSAFMKSIQVPKNTFHLCYCHTPMRFAWDYDTYMEGQSKSNIMKSMLKLYMQKLKTWDKRTSQNVNQFIANSSVVKKRIQNYYQRDSDIIYPPINTTRFKSSEQIGNFYLVVSRLVAYKRIDLAVEVFNRNGLPLYIVGEGTDKKRLMGMAKSNIHFLGRLPDEEVTGLMSQCRALLFPGEEDFGITPLEANAAGRPVIAYEAGGALDTIVPKLNGVFFQKHEVESLQGAIEEIENHSWNVQDIIAHAQKFDEKNFKANFKEYVKQSYAKFLSNRGESFR